MPSPAKTAIVTGASRGIGAAVAARLAGDGFAVVVNFARDQVRAEAVAAAIAAQGGQALAIQADITDPAAVARMFAAARERFGGIDAVVHNAGEMRNGAIAAGDLTAFDRVIASNLRGAFIVLSEAARQVAEGGRIVALSSSVIAPALPGYGAYIAAKAGIEGLVRVLANELRGRRITANAVAPGPVDTELFRAGKSEEQIARMARLPPLERLGEPDDIARVVSFLLGPDGGWMNGQVVRANGGFA